MSDFESEEMGRRYRLDALTTSATWHGEGGKTGEPCSGVCLCPSIFRGIWYVHALDYVDCPP